METPTFDQLPQAVHQLYNKLENIERLLLEKSNEAPCNIQPLTIKEAAKFVKLSVPTLYSFVSRREIPFSKLGKRLYFSQQELAEWVKTGRKKTNAEITAEADIHLLSKKRK